MTAISDPRPAPTPENTSVVTGGPLDPSSPEAQPPEGHVVGAEAIVGTPPPSAEEPLYRGLTGELKTTDDLKNYTRHLEDLFVQAKAANEARPPLPTAPAPPQPGAKEKFAELIFAKPEEAFDIAVQEARSQMTKQVNEERAKERFWERFYEQNTDLKRLSSIVQSLVKERGTEISCLKTESEVSDFISKETRKLVDLVKKETGYTETKLPSGGAVSLGGSREPVPVPPSQPQAPLNFSDQIRRLRPRGK